MNADLESEAPQTEFFDMQNAPISRPGRSVTASAQQPFNIRKR
jgi:hypothetical protein